MGIITAMPVMDMATVIKGTATMIEDTVMALDLGSRSYRGASHGLATIMAPLMASWDHKPGAPFGPTNVRMTN
jgi:acetyl-CoA acetyltransferase